MTLPRPSDAERMDRHYRYQRYIYDLTRTHYLIGRKHLLTELKPQGAQTVLEIGCGTAWNLIRAAKLYPDARVYGVDVSNAMLDTARASIRRHGLQNRIQVSQADATATPAGQLFSLPVFDRVFFSYALSMIPGWQTALVAAATRVAPGGSLHIVDFGQCERLPGAFKAALFAFLDHYSVTPRVDLEQVCESVATTHRASLAFSRLHRGYTDHVVLHFQVAT